MNNIYKSIFFILITFQLSSMETQTKLKNEDGYQNLLQETINSLEDRQKISVEESTWLAQLKPYQLCALFLERLYLPQEIVTTITHKLMQLEYGSKKNFYRELMDVIIERSHTKKQTLLPVTIKTSYDKKYYVGLPEYARSIEVYCSSTDNLLYSIADCNTVETFKTKNLALMYTFNQSNKQYANFKLYNFSTSEIHSLPANLSTTQPPFIAEGDGEQNVMLIKNNKFTVWNVSDLDNIRQCEGDHLNIEFIAYSPESKLLVSSSNENNNSIIFLWKYNSASNTLERVSSYYQNVPHNIICFIKNGKQIIFSHRSLTNPSYTTLKINNDYTIDEKYKVHGSYLDTWYQSDSTQPVPATSCTTYATTRSVQTLKRTEIKHYKSIMPILTTFDYKVANMSISPNETIYAIVLGDTQDGAPIQKVYLQTADKTVVLRDWSPSGVCSHDSIVTFNKSSTLISRSINNRVLIYNNEGRFLKELNGIGNFHPDGKSFLMTNNNHYILYTEEIEKLLQKKIKSATPTTYFLLKNVCLPGVKPEDFFYRKAFNQLQSSKKNLLTQSFNINFSHIDNNTNNRNALCSIL